ncbi:MAG: TadE/TadG family protein [Hoeflea sp.]|uniref:TadE/TadG family protein n=1 Tax=Hoeflea sp. TaxID=1940281 RepID=UPI001DBF9AB0|nr:TadE/TadG family protein [Hoeflea sp.]MBU4527902.1 TadE/TadG family protein [Alphaproteobacteria bacterium]MBU4546063.1 TadE/TadG family protein [Alphaproteobacteria bacterium]MBU4553252.1 TadE/TadG family protein [Alphaproteobacteria bacterium]MBV1724324.1 TadE/TadG family protein [Hoeflea sp.]MBV1763320.1 TadE/TadG family protein [Hoeflea sp.]
MMASILVPVIFIAGSLVLDTTNALSMKTSLQNAADSAVLATTSQLADGKITEDEAIAYATNFFNGQISNDASAFNGFSATPTVTLTKSGTGATAIWKVEVAVLGSQKASGLGKFAGKDTIDVAIRAASESGSDGEDRSPISMMLVLDRSGSMQWASGRTTTETVPKYCTRWVWKPYSWRQETYECGTTTVVTDVPKMDVLKEAVGNLVDHISASDPTNEYARMGAAAYNLETRDGDKLGLTWNKSQVSSFTNGLTATGGTNSADAMEWALQRVNGSGEINEHYSKNGSKAPLKFIVFMTDGENDFGRGNEWKTEQADKKTKDTCQAAKAANVTVFSVAFQAPKRGRDLLEACAFSAKHYFDAQSADDLLKAFTAIGKEASKQVTRLTN